MDSVAKWLETEAGERWSFARHKASRWNSRCWIELIPLDNRSNCGAWLTWEIEYGKTDRKRVPTKQGEAA